jgi:hypothetical protein
MVLSSDPKITSPYGDNAGEDLMAPPALKDHRRAPVKLLTAWKSPLVTPKYRTPLRSIAGEDVTGASVSMDQRVSMW